MNTIPRRPFGQSGLTLPTIGIGCSDMGNRNRPRPPQEAAETGHAALEAGLNWFDVAPYYGLGLAERRLGDALRETPRDDFVISSKVGRPLIPDHDADIGKPRHGFHSPMPFRAGFDYSYDGVMRSWENSLHRLGLARIDILFVHDIGAYAHGEEDPERWREFIGGGLRALNELKSSGAIKAFGLGVNEAAVCHRMLDEAPVDGFLLAGRYTLLDHAGALPLLDRCYEQGVSVIAAGPYNTGLLAGGSRRSGAMRYDYGAPTAEVLDRLNLLEVLCGAHGVPLVAAALQFGLGHRAVASVLPGVAGAARVAETHALATITIPAAFWAELAASGIIASGVPLPSVKG
ncbi:D-threo-aldose 1-dehydrogenase [Novosphingobium sp. SG751A]|uniref:aldo/keto reductase n=1 Tax=Novosphingobium sp. SG751A TaxID=2587000 RepID=UPI0015530BC5|nr:aldo/keto reductase [Novosphingobium sp. SG751A]NOW48436.1 D-threo-aldose 1-dehydrogenase [Novosphingobium sp. SG751A]